MPIYIGKAKSNNITSPDSGRHSKQNHGGIPYRDCFINRDRFYPFLLFVIKHRNDSIVSGCMNTCQSSQKIIAIKIATYFSQFTQCLPLSALLQILSGEVDIVLDGVVHHMTPGDLIHIEPEEVHYVINRSDKMVKMVSTLAPFQEVDKVEVDNPVID